MSIPRRRSPVADRKRTRAGFRRLSPNLKRNQRRCHVLDAPLVPEAIVPDILRRLEIVSSRRLRVGRPSRSTANGGTVPAGRKGGTADFSGGDFHGRCSGCSKLVDALGRAIGRPRSRPVQSRRCAASRGCRSRPGTQSGAARTGWTPHTQVSAATDVGFDGVERSTWPRRHTRARRRLLTGFYNRS